MKKRPPLSPRQLLLCAVIVLSATILLVLLLGQHSDRKQFSKLSHDLFVEEMTANTLNMHYTIANPEAFGISSYEPVLPCYGDASGESARASLQATLDTLYDIQPKRLSGQDAYTYELLTRLLENSAQLKAFPYYQEPLSPASGLQSQLPILLAEYTFRSKRDVEDYLALLDQTDTYFESLLLYEQEKYAAGLSMSASSLRQVREQCDTIVTKEALESGTHFLQTTFQERLNELVADRVITAKEAEQYLSQNNRLLRTVVRPAYEKLADGIFLLEDAEGVEPLPTGLSARPQGREYYQYLLISETGSYRPVAEIKSLLTETLRAEYKAIGTLAAKDPNLAMHLATKEYCTLPFQKADEMLADLQSRMKEDFPMLKDSPRVSVKTVSANLEDYCAPAFYLTAPLDDTDNNVIYINKKDASSDLELYTTLAHEGYPGHLYQTVYSNQDFMNQGKNEVRQLLWYGGYLEGWALYVEFYGYDYAADLLERDGRTEDALCVQLEKHNRSLLLCLYSTMDIMIHYENASREEIAQMLAGFGIKNETAVNAIYSYIADEPCNYLKYYLGYLEILELKKAAQEQWGTAYSDYAFHSFLLDAGPSDFIALRKLLNHASPDTASPAKAG